MTDTLQPTTTETPHDRPDDTGEIEQILHGTTGGDA